jgi:hypothetical protein
MRGRGDALIRQRPCSSGDDFSALCSCAVVQLSRFAARAVYETRALFTVPAGAVVTADHALRTHEGWQRVRDTSEQQLRSMTRRGFEMRGKCYVRTAAVFDVVGRCDTHV